VTLQAPKAAILLVDDDPDLMRFIAAALGRSGFTVLTAETPQQALLIHSARRDEIALLLSDVIMPQMTGVDLAHVLQQTHPELKVLFMSGYRAAHLQKFGEVLSAYQVLSKPFTPAELLQAVKSMMDSETMHSGK